MTDKLLQEWAELQKVPARTVGDVHNKANHEIEIAESLQREGYTGELNGFHLWFIIDDRKRAVVEMYDRLKEIRG